MVAEQSWSSFHHKYGSEEFRRSTEYDRGDGKGVVRTLLKKCSSRKLIVTEENVGPTLLRSISSRNSLRSLVSDDKRRPSLSRSAPSAKLLVPEKNIRLSLSRSISSQNSLRSLLTDEKRRSLPKRRNSLYTTTT